MDTTKLINHLFYLAPRDFSYPYYANLDRRIARHLSSEFVDAVGELWKYRRKMTLPQWRKAVLARLQELGAKEVM
jgi:hypothetical protein